MKKIIIFLISFVVSIGVFASNVQPKIMVIPFVKEDEDIRTILEEDANKRIVLTKVKEAFDSRGFTTVDFLGKLKSASIQDGLGGDQQEDIKTMIINNSGADIYVDTEIIYTPSSSGNSVKVIVTAYDISTGNSLSNKVGDSGKFYTDDVGRLGSKAIESVAEDFLNIMQMKFDDIVENGRSINLRVGFADSSSYNMDSEVGKDGYTLADEIDIWLEKNAYQGNYHLQGTSSKQLLADDIKIPLKDENGNNYNINKFWREFQKFIRSLGLKASRTISNNSLIVTIE